MSLIGKKIKEKREEKGYSLKKLGDICGISDSEVMKIENDSRKKINWNHIFAICKELSIDPIKLLEESGIIGEKSISLKNLEKLNEKDLERVQTFIDFLVFEKERASKTVFRLGELFCGPGGLACGASLADINNDDYRIVHQWANDFDADTCRTYTNNICPDKPESVICEDVHTLDIDALGPIDALAYGFPCNDFSVVGEQLGFKGKYGPLYTYGIKVLEKYKPMWFLAENVGGIKSANEGKAFEKIKEDMINAGYRIYPNLYKFEEYGVPQARHRVIIIGIRNDLPYEFKIPSPEPYKNLNNTCRNAIENPPIPADAPNNEITKQSPKVVERLKYIKPGQNAFNADLPDELKLNVKGAKISQIYKRLDPNKPAYTVTGSGGGGTHIYHWEEPRALTNRERARLQTFPDDYVFEGSKESVRKQIGMAVPVQGAKIIFEAVLKTFAGIEYESVEANMTE